MNPEEPPEETPLVSLATPPDAGPWLVGVGASAGGIDALGSLIPGLPENAVYIIAQHMSPAHPSLLSEVLSRDSSLPVVELSDGTRY